MKERYESRIKEMEEEKETLEEQKEEMDQLVPKLREEIKKLQSQGGSGDQNVTNDSQSLLNEVWIYINPFPARIAQLVAHVKLWLARYLFHAGSILASITSKNYD